MSAPAPPLTQDEVAAALEHARALTRAGIPVRAARPAHDERGVWDPHGGTSGCGFWLPPGWQQSHPDPSYVDAWRPGWGLLAIMGHGLDLLDVDPRNGGEASRAELVEARVWPSAYGVASTPSGGTHEFVASLGVHSRDGVRPGLDVKAGDADSGQGRGFAWIAPTVKLSKTTGELRPYRWVTPPDLRALSCVVSDDTGRALAELVRAAQGGKRAGKGKRDQAGDDRQWLTAGSIPIGVRYDWLVRYAGYLLSKNLPIDQARDLMRKRWEACEQRDDYVMPLGPDGGGVVTDDETALGILAKIYATYDAGHAGGEAPSDVAPAPETGGRSVLPPPTAPMAVARAVAAEYTHDGVGTLRRWRGGWMQWTGPAWAETEPAGISSQLYTRTEHAIYADKEGRLIPWAPNRRRIGDLADALGAITLTPSTVDTPAWLDGSDGPATAISCANGLLDLDGRKLASHDPGYFNLVSVPFDYDADAAEPSAWLAFLGQLWPDDAESIAALQEWFGYVLSGRTNLQKILLIVGPKRGGKGTIARILQRLVGAGNHVGLALASLATNFGMQPLIGKPLAVVPDARLDGRGPNAIVERLLSISGEDTLTVDRKHREAWTGKLPTRLMVLSNELPEFRDASSAIVSRFITLVGTGSWLGREDTALESKLVAELPGILNWALDGLDRLNRSGRLTEPAASRDAEIAMSDSASPEGAFVRDRCKVGAGHEIETERLFAAWCGWCGVNGRARPGTVQTFSRALRAVVPTIKTARPRTDERRGRVLLGITLRENEADNTDTGPRWSADHAIARDARESPHSGQAPENIDHNGLVRGPSRTSTAQPDHQPTYRPPTPDQMNPDGLNLRPYVFVEKVTDLGLGGSDPGAGS